ncbi:hypothetical protein [Aquabacterium sp. OR-4]|uniref:hypothetical protein n=1 Tax=Aquabacterium sp. OR-4 TaxID=2978127 RepID=UPI0028C8AC28|nr:hypothetical protein [Aquabacterium sp. OR-4]MDT7836060.1 hypothetical protein [Aquabacterium sp. OR-4]
MQIDPNASGALAGAVNAATAQVNAPATAQANAQAPALATSRTPRWFRHAAARRETPAPRAGRMVKHGMVRAQPVRGAWLSRIRAALQQRADRAEHGTQLRHEAGHGLAPIWRSVTCRSCAQPAASLAAWWGAFPGTNSALPQPAPRGPPSRTTHEHRERSIEQCRPLPSAG